MTKQLITAVAFAADKHKNQRRKDAKATPYINHPIGLAELCERGGCAIARPDRGDAARHDRGHRDDVRRDLRGAFGRRWPTSSWRSPTTSSCQGRAQAPADRGRPRAQPSGRTGEARGQDLQPARHRALPPTDWSLAGKRKYFDWAKEVVDQAARGSSRHSSTCSTPPTQRGRDESIETRW